ncbi:MAG: hypothetical protein C0609_06520 [Deltaproteobacteria bacterium]|nr:MAG: hypothetical protein C0609_06520 [Deltaproteobacteria bacterium]
MSGAKAFLLAAGFGKRMLPFTERMAKAALPFFGKPLAAWSLDSLKSAGVRDVTVNLHHLGESVKAALAPYIDASLNLSLSEEDHILGTGGGVKRCLPALAGGELCILNADTYRDFELKRMKAFHDKNEAVVTLALAPAPPKREAPIEVGPDGRVLRFLGAGPGGGTPCDFIGAHLFSPEGVEAIGAVGAESFCINAEVNRHLVERGAKVFGVLIEEGRWWSDLGTPQRFMEGHRHFLGKGVLPPGCSGHLVTMPEVAAAGGKILGPSWVGESIVVEEGAVAGPYAVLGEGCRVMAGASFESSILFPGATAQGTKLGSLISPEGLEALVDI